MVILVVTALRVQSVCRAKAQALGVVRHQFQRPDIKSFECRSKVMQSG